MNTPELLADVAIVALLVAAILARRSLRTNPGLRRAFYGLGISAICGRLLSSSPPAATVWPIALIMLAGVAILIAGLSRGDGSQNQIGR